MAAKADARKIKLESTAGTGHFYTTDKNKKTTPEKMLIKKFDPKARKRGLQGSQAEVIRPFPRKTAGIPAVFSSSIRDILVIPHVRLASGVKQCR